MLTDEFPQSSTLTVMILLATEDKANSLLEAKSWSKIKIFIRDSKKKNNCPKNYETYIDFISS